MRSFGLVLIPLCLWLVCSFQSSQAINVHNDARQSLTTHDVSLEPLSWPSRMSFTYSVFNMSEEHGSATNVVDVLYDGKRMRLDSRNCTGGSPARTDLRCVGTFVDGKLFASGSDDHSSWCCVWHDKMWPSTPGWMKGAILHNASAVFYGIEAIAYKKVPFYNRHSATYYENRKSRLPLGLSGIGHHNTDAWLFADIFVIQKEIPVSKFKIEGGNENCQNKCDWDNAFSLLPVSTGICARSPGQSIDAMCTGFNDSSPDNTHPNPHCKDSWE